MEDHLIRSTGGWFPQTNPTHHNYLYFNYLNNIQEIKGNVKVQLLIPTSYKIAKINKDQVGKEISINKNLKIKLLAFEDNIIHFEVLDNKELELNITYSGYYGGSTSFVIEKSLYDFYRMNPGLTYPQFEKKAEAYYDSIEKDKEVRENYIYIYKLVNKVDKFYLYQIDETTQLTTEKELTL